ncbi:hypothetical protein BH23CHL8_BH23CHL8_21850 [soil metagenome]
MGSTASVRSLRAPAAMAALAVAISLAATGIYVLLAERSQPSALAALERTVVDRATLPQAVPVRRVGGHLVVEAQLGGDDGSVPLILDTGAPTSISADLADRVAGGREGQIALSSVDGEDVMRDIVVVPHVRLGGAAFSDVGVVRTFMNIDGPLGCVSRHGLIGASLMKEAVWQIDYAGGSRTIAPGVEGLDHVEGAIALPFTDASAASPSPILEIGVGEGRLRFLVDTGSDGWLAVHPEDLAGVGVLVDPEGPAYWTQASGSAGGFLARVLYGAADVALGDHVLEALPIATIDALPPGLGSMGNAFLRHFVVTIDWPGWMLYLDPVALRPEPEVPVLARVAWRGTEAVVVSFVEGPAAREAGLVIGLPVLTLDGHDLTGGSTDDPCALALRDPADQFDMTVRGGRTVHVAPVEDFFRGPGLLAETGVPRP